jgi:hypothetical protein
MAQGVPSFKYEQESVLKKSVLKILDNPSLWVYKIQPIPDGTVIISVPPNQW